MEQQQQQKSQIRTI